MRTLAPFFVALVATGCASTDSATLIVPSEQAPGFTLISVNPNLARSAEPTELRRGMAEDGVTPKFSLLLQNTTASAQRLNYRVEWLDATDAPVRGQVDVARELTVPAGGVQSITAVAPGAKAKRFRLWLTDVGGADAVR